MRERDGGRSRDERERARQQEQARQQDQAAVGSAATDRDRMARQQQAAADRNRLAAQQRAAANQAQQRAANSYRPLDRVRDADLIRQREVKARALEQQHPKWMHSFREHVDASEAELARRAATGMTAGGDPRDSIPDHATRWQSGAARVIAADYLWNTSEDQRKEAEREGKRVYDTRRPLSEVLGPDWRQDVYGRSHESNGTKDSQWRQDSQAVAAYRMRSGRWYLTTCYPEVEPSKRHK